MPKNFKNYQADSDPESDSISLHPAQELKVSLFAQRLLSERNKAKKLEFERVPTLLQANDWVVKIDLTQAYFHLPIAQSHQRYLRVLYTPEATRRPELLQITCLPFGLSSSPKAFATVSNWVTHLRSKGLRIIVYLDDFLIAHQDRHMLQDQAAEAIRVLTLLGWMVNFQNSVLNPTKVIEYLGISWNLHVNSKQLPIDKVLRISARIQGLLRDNRWSVKQAQCILGMLNFAAFVVPRGPPYSDGLQQIAETRPFSKVPNRSASCDGTLMVARNANAEHADTSASGVTSYHNRHLWQGLGCTSGQFTGQRDMEPRTKALAQQPEGNVGFDTSNIIIQTAFTEFHMAPRWHRVYWRPDLKMRAVSAPYTIINLRNCLFDTRTLLPPPQVDQVHLEVWLVKGGPNI
ncbi:putative transposon Ty3-I Gag-Pol polyprotein [Operophtera brumata]|uniref:Putative transposon Ty3-I Gag-Pol polyprotein n=1 Tax=Operophtera brumata TaxID=104452 RepID=A0A0L7L874_OPEBR|nr:putative transposon Ty3-I Gag-Pol polyprotein [Operophtera brumata]